MKSGALAILVGLLALWAELTSASGQKLPVKSGFCPVPSKGNCFHYYNYCSRDAKCPGSERCCKTSCGQECQRPFLDHPGYCPRLSPQPGQARNCKTTCKSDRDCGSGTNLPIQKCCSNGCGQTCQVAEAEHSGMCPKREVVYTFAPCKDTCQDDRDCPSTQKCCFTGCSRGCLDSDHSYRCFLLQNYGACNESFPRYYYNSLMEQCIQFSYTGCGGNENNFETKEACEEACRKTIPEVHMVPKDTGPCKGQVNELCEGEGFQFCTKLECLFVCGSLGNLGMETKGK